MARSGQPDTCVFCDRPIGADEPRVGRGEAAAHAACADASLVDGGRWERVAAALAEDESAPGDESWSAPAPGAGPGDEPAAGRGPGPGEGTPRGAGAARSGCAMTMALLWCVAVALSRQGPRA